MNPDAIIVVTVIFGVFVYLILDSKRHSKKLTQKALLEAKIEFPEYSQLAAQVFIHFANNFNLDYSCVSFNSSLWDDFGFKKHPSIVSDFSDIISDVLDREVDENIAKECITLRDLAEVAISMRKSANKTEMATPRKPSD